MSKKKQAAWMREYRAKKEEEEAVKTVLLPKGMVKRLQKQGISVRRWLTAEPVSLDDYRDLERQLAAKQARVEWQSGGIRVLHEEVAVLEAKIAMLPAMQDGAVLQRIAALEVGVVLHEAEHALVEAVERHDLSRQRSE